MLQALLEHNLGITIHGITLSEKNGGHPVMPEVLRDRRVEVQYLDMNLMASAMGVPASDIPAEHPDVVNFYSEVPFEGAVYDIVISDGTVLRTHEREEYRREKEREGLRLRLGRCFRASGTTYLPPRVLQIRIS